MYSPPPTPVQQLPVTTGCLISYIVLLSLSNTHCPAKPFGEGLLSLSTPKTIKISIHVHTRSNVSQTSFPQNFRMTLNLQGKRWKKFLYQTCVTFYFLNSKQFIPKSKVYRIFSTHTTKDKSILTFGLEKWGDVSKSNLTNYLIVK